MRAILLALALLPLAPIAAADDVCAPLGLPATACVFEDRSADGDCDSGGYESGVTVVQADVPGVASFFAGGAAYCYGPSGQNSIFFQAHTPAGGMGGTMTEFYYSDPENGEFRQCFVASDHFFQPCPDGVSPPNPGWGAILP